MDTKKLRQKILDLAIHGKLVTQDPNDEPASVLLERIKAEKERLIQEGKIKRSKKSVSSDTPHYAKDVPFGVPQGWVWCKFEDVLSLISGQDFPPQKYNEKSIGIPYIIGASNIYNGKLVINRWTNVPSVLSYKNDLLVVCKGAGVGKMAMNDVGDVHIARQIQALRSNSEIMNMKFVQMVIAYNITDIISGANGLIPGLKRELLLSLKIPLPPISEQHRIVVEIERWFDLIDNIEQDKEDFQTVIKQAKNKILDLAIHGKLVPQDLNDEPASELLKRINPHAKITCDNAHSRKLPINWISCKLSDICIFLSRGKSPEYSDVKKYPVFAQKCNLKDGSISIEKARFLNPDTLNKWQDIYQLQEDDIVINSTGTGTVGRVGLFKLSCLGSYPLIVPDSHISVVRTFEEINSMYIYTLLKTQACQTYFEDNLAGSTNQKELYISVIANTEISLPPVKEQKRIVAKIEELFNNLDHIETALQA